MSAPQQVAQPPTEFEPCEKIVIPQKIYYRRGSLHTIAREISTEKCALFANNLDLDIMKMVETEMSCIASLKRIYPMFVDDNNHATAQQNIQSILPSVDTVVAIGSYKLFNELAQQLSKNIKQLILVPTDAKPIALMSGTFVDEEGKIIKNEKLIPELVVLDSGITHNISKHDVELLAQIAAVEEDTQWVQFTKTAKEISAELIQSYGKLDMPVWCERATNLVGITMLGKPNGERVVKALGLAK